MQKALMDALIQDLRPVEVVTTSSQRARGILAAIAFGSTPLAIFFPIRMDILEELKQPHFLAAFVILFSLSSVCFWMALRLGVPGEVRSPVKKACIALFLYFIAQTLYAGSDGLILASAPKSDFRCAFQLLVCALIPYGVFFYYLSKLSPTHWIPTLIFALVGSFSLSGLILQISCGVDLQGHRWMGHSVLTLIEMLLLLGPSLIILRRIQSKRELSRTSIKLGYFID